MTVGMIANIALAAIALWQLFAAARWEKKADLYQAALLTMAESLGENGIDVDIEERGDGISVTMQFPVANEEAAPADID